MADDLDLETKKKANVKVLRRQIKKHRNRQTDKAKTKHSKTSFP